MSDTRNYLYTIKAMYLGSEPMGELLDGQNGSDAIQIPLKKTIQRTDALGDEVELSMTPESLIINFVNEPQRSICLPIDLLAYCGALRQVPSDKVRERVFETLDKSPNTGDSDPPLFVTIFRHDDYETTLFCHSFVIRKDDEAMEMVKLVMEIYYNLVRLQDMDETMENNTTQITTPTTPNNTNVINQINESASSNASSASSSSSSSSSASSFTGKSDRKPTEDTFVNSFLSQANSNTTSNTANNSRQEMLTANLESLNLNASKTESNTKVEELIIKKLENNNYEIVSANELIKKTIDSYENEMNKKSANDEADEKKKESGENTSSNSNNELDLIDNYSNLPINNDQSPIIIKKPNNEQIVYKQNVFIRWLQPPTPPPPAPIIIREIQEPAPEQLPPLVIYKQAPRPETPPPLVIRERPPSPLNHPREPLIIERRVQAPPPTQRKIIIENLPAPPPKPRDIILEKWLPSKETTSQRPVYYQKAYKTTMTQSQLFSSSSSQKPVYEFIDQRNEHVSPTHYEYIDSQGNGTKKIYKQIIRNSSSSSSSNNNNNKKSPILEQQHHQSSDMIYAPTQIYSSPSQSMHQVVSQPSEIYYTPNPNRKSKVAGYRIIRQIIPGPNSTPADIEKALARSQRISTVYPNQSRKIYSPSFDMNTSSSYQQYPIYSSGAGASQQQNYEYFYSPSSRLNTSGSASNHHKQHLMMNSSMINPVMHQSAYAPHNIYTKNDIYRSNSIDNF